MCSRRFVMSTQPTIKDVARLAGVSIGTVDRVVHNRGKVSARNQQAVQSAIDSLGYKPSRIASALVKRRSNIKIGVCISDVESEFWAEAMEGVRLARESLLPFGIEVLEISTNSYHFRDQKQAIEQLLAQGANALLVLPLQGKSNKLDEVIPPDIPYATVIEDAPASRRLFHVGPDDYAMGLLAGRLSLLYSGKGKKYVVLASNQTFCGTQERIRGFRNFFAKHDPSSEILEICDVSLDSERIGYQSIYEIAEEQMQKHSDINAFYVTNGLTQWAAAAVKNNKRQGDILVFGFERTEMTYSFIREGIIGATICQGPAQQWYNAVMIMNAYLAGEREISNPIFNAECKILIEESLPFVRLDGISTF